MGRGKLTMPPAEATASGRRKSHNCAEEEGGRCASSSYWAGATLTPVDAHLQPRKLPGEEFITQGIRDLERGLESPEALLVSIGAPRLRRFGLNVPRVFDSPEHRLYELLRLEHGDAAHSRYNALVRRLVRYERSAGVAGSRRA